MNTKNELTNNPVILVVDDSKYIRSILKGFLEKNEYQVVEATNGKEAVAKCQDCDPDLILIDYLMPEMDGITAVKKLRKSLEYDLVPIIMITSLGDEKSVNYAFEVGATDFISKPINFPLLKHRINNLVRARKTEISLIENERYARSIIENALDGIIMVNMCGKIKAFNPSAEKIFGFETTEILGEEINKIIPEFYCEECGDCPSIEQLIEDKINSKKNIVLTGFRKDGLHIPLEMSVSSFTLKNKIYYAIILRDITIRQKYEKKIRYQAFYDNTTGIPNRLLLKERLKAEINHCKISSDKLALVYLDLDRFKLINDTLGHTTGDKLLKLVAERLVKILDEDDSMARMGGDEFAILLPKIKTKTQAIQLAVRVLESIRKPFLIEGHELFITASLGIAFCPSDGKNVDNLIKNADMAMYSAKDLGRNTFEIYTMKMNNNVFQRLELESKLRTALENKEFVIHYQPKINADSMKVVGFEALLRWEHPILGLIPPIQFIPLAEETGLIVSIGEWVLEEACLQAKRWQDEGFGGLHVAVNLSIKQFQLQNITHTIKRVLEQTGLESRFLELEITESIAMEDVQHTLKVMGNLKEMGVNFSIDDFGTGYSSLSYLQKFAINKLKIDRSFVNEIGLKKEDGVIASTIITLAKSLNMKIVAEGVETKIQCEFLKNSKCDEMQGYLFGKPVPPQEFRQLFLELDANKQIQEC